MQTVPKCQQIIRNMYENEKVTKLRKLFLKLLVMLFCLFVCLFGFLTSSSTTRLYLYGPQDRRLTILRAATQETELGDHDFCLSRSHYTDTDQKQYEAGGRSGNRTRDLLTRSRALNRLSYRAPLLVMHKTARTDTSNLGI